MSCSPKKTASHASNSTPPSRSEDSRRPSLSSCKPAKPTAGKSSPWSDPAKVTSATHAPKFKPCCTTPNCWCSMEPTGSPAASSPPAAPLIPTPARCSANDCPTPTSSSTAPSMSPPASPLHSHKSSNSASRPYSPAVAARPHSPEPPYCRHSTSRPPAKSRSCPQEAFEPLMSPPSCNSPAAPKYTPQSAKSSNQQQHRTIAASTSAFPDTAPSPLAAPPWPHCNNCSTPSAPPAQMPTTHFDSTTAANPHATSHTTSHILR